MSLIFCAPANRRLSFCPLCRARRLWPSCLSASLLQSLLLWESNGNQSQRRKQSPVSSVRRAGGEAVRRSKNDFQMYPLCKSLYVVIVGRGAPLSPSSRCLDFLQFLLCLQHWFLVLYSGSCQLAYAPFPPMHRCCYVLQQHTIRPQLYFLIDKL